MDNREIREKSTQKNRKKRKKKYRIIWSRFIPALILFAALTALAVFGILQLFKDKTPQSESNSSAEQQNEETIKEDPPQPPQPTQEEIFEARRSGEYMILTNKTHPLGSDYKPDDLVTIDRFVVGVGNDETHKLRKDAADALNLMLDAAADAGYTIKLRTGFRSYSYQESLYNSYVDKNGKEKADTFSAQPGKSEHQTGLACDLGCKSNDYALTYKFGDTDEGKWVAEHACEYGFIIRFTDGTETKPGPVTGYIFEPWHIRYVGTEAATEIKKLGITLEEYLGIL